MSEIRFSETELEAFLDEALSPDLMNEIEKQLRADPQLLQSLAAINSRRDLGVHTIGAIWRRHRLSCPTREQLGSFLLGAIDEVESDYVRFHVEDVGCPYCRASLEDMRERQRESEELVVKRREKYFQSSAGYFRK